MKNDGEEASVLAHIQRLVGEEHRLFEQGALAEYEDQRLKDVQVELDQCWDLLRQRRAAREFGRDPSESQARPAEVVEKYRG
jgi:hypothetical protein